MEGLHFRQAFETLPSGSLNSIAAIIQREHRPARALARSVAHLTRTIVQIERCVPGREIEPAQFRTHCAGTAYLTEKDAMAMHLLSSDQQPRPAIQGDHLSENLLQC